RPSPAVTVDFPSPAPLLVTTSVLMPRCRESWSVAASESKYASSTMSPGRRNAACFRFVHRTTPPPESLGFMRRAAASPAPRDHAHDRQPELLRHVARRVQRAPERLERERQP